MVWQGCQGWGTGDCCSSLVSVEMLGASGCALGLLSVV